MDHIPHAEDLLRRTRQALPATAHLSWDVEYVRDYPGPWTARVFLASAYDPFDPEAPAPIAEFPDINLDAVGDVHRVHLCGPVEFVWIGDPRAAQESLALGRMLIEALLSRIRLCEQPTSTPPER